MKSWHEINFLSGFANLIWARPTIAFWDLDWDFCNQSEILRLIMRLLAGGLKAWDRPWDHPGLSLSLETKVLLISVPWVVARLHLVAPMDFWQTSTQFFHMTKIGHYRKGPSWTLRTLVLMFSLSLMLNTKITLAIPPTHPPPTTNFSKGPRLSNSRMLRFDT